MLGVVFTSNWYTIKSQVWVMWFIFLDRKNNFHSLFSDIRIKDHFPLVAPLRNCFKILDQLLVSCMDISDGSEYR